MRRPARLALRDAQNVAYANATLRVATRSTGWSSPAKQPAEPASRPASQPSARFLRNATRNADARDVSSVGTAPADRCRRRRRRRRRRGRGRRGGERHDHGILAKKARIEHSRARPNVAGDRTSAPLRSAPPLAAYLHEAATSRASVRFKGTERRLASSRRPGTLDRWLVWRERESPFVKRETFSKDARRGRVTRDIPCLRTTWTYRRRLV